MTDIVDKNIRRLMMSSIRNKNTKPEMTVRRILHKMGFRYRLHDRKLPGTPDLVFPRYHAVLFVHGCFWHGHQCSIFKWPATNPEFWSNKIRHNMNQDVINRDNLLKHGWRVGVIWECALRKPSRPISEISETIALWIRSDVSELEITA